MNDPALCPSAPPREGALLLGRFTEEGTLALAANPLPVTASFLAIAEKEGDIAKRFRFTSPCLQSACSRWQNGQCAVGSAAARVAEQQGVEVSRELPACAIRGQCRWFAQEGAQACHVCPQVVYDMNDQVRD